MLSSLKNSYLSQRFMKCFVKFFSFFFLVRLCILSLLQFKDASYKTLKTRIKRPKTILRSCLFHSINYSTLLILFSAFCLFLFFLIFEFKSVLQVFKQNLFVFLFCLTVSKTRLCSASTNRSMQSWSVGNNKSSRSGIIWPQFEICCWSERQSSGRKSTKTIKVCLCIVTCDQANRN